jgi:hypothetical protein
MLVVYGFQSGYLLHGIWLSYFLDCLSGHTYESNWVYVNKVAR